MENKEVITIIEKENLINCQINIDKQKENNYNITNEEKLTFEEIVRLLRLLEDKIVEEYNSSILSDNSAEYIREDTSVNNVHDKIFRTILNKEKEALYLINKFSNIQLKVNDIEKYNSSYITKKLQNKECDIVYKVKEKDIYFLIEHQTAVDRTMPKRILEYMIEIMKSAYTNKNHTKDELALIIPIVLYTGRRKWIVKRYIKDIIPETKLYLKNLKNFELYKLVDINNYTEQELLEDKSFITKAMLMEKIRNIEDFKEILIEIRKRIKKEEEFELFEKLIRYILLNNMEIEEREKYIEEIMKGGEEKMLNSQRVIRNEFRRSKIDGIRQGRAEGRIDGITDGIKQGRLETISQVIKSMLKENLPIALISKITNTPEEEIKKIK